LSGWGLFFLGVIALGSLAQTAFLVFLAINGKRLAARVDAISQRFEKELRPSLENLARVTRDLSEITEIGRQQTRRIDATLSDTLDKIEGFTGGLQRLVADPLSPFVRIAAFVKGVRRGMEVWGQLRGHDRRSRPPSRRYSGESDDEHLFI
jgi:hypothetical protein